MKIKIKGELGIAELGEAFMAELRYCDFDKNKHYIKGQRSTSIFMTQKHMQ